MSVLPPVSKLANEVHVQHHCSTLQIHHKPGGYPVTGSSPFALFNTAPILPILSAPPRPISGPVILCATPLCLRHHLFAIVTPPPIHVNIPSTESVEIIRIVHAPHHDLALLHIIAPHAGTGLRTALRHAGCEIVGSGGKARMVEGLAVKGLYVCVWKVCVGEVEVCVGMPRKFETLINRAEKLGERKRKRDCERIKEGQVKFGENWFWTQGCMRPRISSELVARRAGEWLAKRFRDKVKMEMNESVNIIDLGCGCGNLVVMALEVAGVGNGIGVDCSEIAVQTARRNVRKLDKQNCVKIECVGFEDVVGTWGKEFDVIVCNPPYLSAKQVDKMGDWFDGEPREALVGGEDGMEGYREIGEISDKLIRQGGVVVVEVGGKRKGDDVAKCFKRMKMIENLRDASGFDRCIVLSLECEEMI